MKNKVITTLQIPPNHYELLVLSIYFHWCSKFMKNPKSIQKALICKPLFNWWQREFEKLESEFLEASKPYHNSMSSRDALKLYSKTTGKIHSRFSKPLIQHVHES